MHEYPGDNVDAFSSHALSLQLKPVEMLLLPAPRSECPGARAQGELSPMESFLPLACQNQSHLPFWGSERPTPFPWPLSEGVALFLERGWLWLCQGRRVSFILCARSRDYP